jgi:hypothetical protein
MICTKSSPIVFLNIICEVINKIFPVVEYVNMSSSSYDVVLIYLGVLSEWITNFINLFINDEKKIFVYSGNTFVLLTISMLSSEMTGEKADNFAGFLLLLFLSYVFILVISGFISYGITVSSFIFMLKKIFINPIFIGYWVAMLRFILPMLLMLFVILPLAFIPIKIIQIIGICIVLFLGFFFKHFSDKLVDKIDHNEKDKLIRFIGASIIIIAEILIATGHYLPSAC